MKDIGYKLVSLAESFSAMLIKRAEGCSSMVNTIKAALCFGPMDVRVVDQPKPTLEQGEVLVHVKLCMTSGTTVKQYARGYPSWTYPFGWGYEWAGIIEEVGPGVGSSLMGKKVIPVYTRRDDNCWFCRHEQPNLCAGMRLPRAEELKTQKPKNLESEGAFREYIKLKVNRIKILPENLSLEDAASVPTVSVVIHGNYNVDINPNDTVLIIGAGGIGQLHGLVSKLRGAQTIMIDRSQERLDSAKKNGAADWIFAAGTTEEAKNKLKELNINEGWGPDVAIEAIGQPATWEEAIELVRRGGQVLEYGGCKEGTSITVDTYRLHYDEIKIVSSTTLSPIDWTIAYELVEKGRIKPSIFISGSYPLTEIKTALENHMNQKGLRYAVIP
jgi:L-iditol 2-dehydrogenase